MATDLENLQAALSGVRLKLKNALTGDYTDAEEFKPGTPGGLDRNGYIDRLMSLEERLSKQISELDVFEITSEMRP